MYLVDFDRTLFRTDDFYEHLRSSALSDVSKKQWEDAYVSYQTRHTVMNIFEMIKSDLHGSLEQVAHIKKVAAESASSFIYSHAHELLTVLNEQRGVTLFTYGDQDFQKFKLQAAGFDVYQSIVSSAPKHSHPIIHEAVVCIDDSPVELESIAEKNETIQLIRISHPSSKYTEIPHTSHRITNVTSLQELIAFNKVEA